MDFEKFAKLISQLESSGGKNTKHQAIEGGLQDGQVAVGKYGLLPNTIEEMVKRAQLEGTSLPEMDELSGMEQSSISQRVAKNPELEEEIAFRLYDHISKKTKDPEKMAYMWNSGHNMDPEKATIGAVNDPYVDKFNKALKQEPDRDKIFKEELARRIKTDIRNPQDPKMLALEKLTKGY